MHACNCAGVLPGSKRLFLIQIKLARRWISRFKHACRPLLQRAALDARRSSLRGQPRRPATGERAVYPASNVTLDEMRRATEAMALLEALYARALALFFRRAEAVERLTGVRLLCE